MRNNEAEALAGWGFRDCHILVVGDFMLDEYLIGTSVGLSPEAPVPVVSGKKVVLRLGGAGNVVMNLHSLGHGFNSTVSAMGVVGSDSEGNIIRERLFGLKPRVNDFTRLVRGRQTTKKARIIGNRQQIVRYDIETTDPIDKFTVQSMLDTLKDGISSYSAILISDYGKGVLTKEFLDGIGALARTASVPLIVDPKGVNFAKYKGATVLTPNKKEAIAAARWHGLMGEERLACSSFVGLMNKLGLAKMTVTCGAEGVLVYNTAPQSKNNRGVLLRANARKVFDVSGAGDTFMATLGYGMACGVEFEEAARVANVAAGIVVGKPGTSAVGACELLGALRGS